MHKDFKPATLFLCGDVMTGRGIDQVLPHPSNPRIFEPYLQDAREYVNLAERVYGPILKPIGFVDIWGEALPELERIAPALRLINLETAVTDSEELWQGKGINYRMHPRNAQIFSEANITVASLANNHVMDWGYSGLKDTIRTLKRINIRTAGAGMNKKEAEAPAIIRLNASSRVVVFSFATGSSGVPDAWAAHDDRPGVNLLPDFSAAAVLQVRDQVEAIKQANDIVIASIHWGDNWGYEVTAEEEYFARSLIDQAGVDLIHGHSSHHVKRIEVHKGKLIIYGCGDFLNDYEGIGGTEYYRPELGLMYFPEIDPESGNLLSLEMTPTMIRHFRINRASRGDAEFLAEVLNREGKDYGIRVSLDDDGRLHLEWVR